MSYRSFRNSISTPRGAWILVMLLLPGLATAQASGDEDDEAIEEIVVKGTSSRISADLSSVPGSVTVIGADELEEQALFSTDLGEILQREVPGFGVSSSASFSNFAQTLRGRKPAVFIDGVPTTVPLRDGGRDLRVISPGAIGNVEVIRGSTALYGLGGAGGLINYATREPGDGPVEFRTDVSVGSSLTHFSDSLNYTLQQSASGRSGRFSYVLSGFYEAYNSLFDAKGERIPPDPQGQGGIADSSAYNVFAKFGFELAEDQALFFSANLYEIEQDTDYSNGVGEFGSRPAPAVEQEPLGEDQATENNLFSLRYVNEDILGSTVNAQVFYSDYEAVFGFFEAPVFPPDGGQSLIDAERTGLRFDVRTPLETASVTGNLLWGVDFITDTTSQPMVDGRLLVPEMEQDSLAPFVQAELAFTDTFTVVGGLRYEDAEISTGQFTTIAIFDPSLPGGVTVEAGSVDYSETLFNIGFVWSPFPQTGGNADLNLFGGYSQGFTVNDFGRALRATTVGTIAEFDFQAQVIDSYEVGIRGQGEIFDWSVAAFYNESEFGSTFNAVDLSLVRAPEEIWGAEVTLDARPNERWRLGTSVSWVNGEVEQGGTTRQLDTSRIPPLKFTASAEYIPSDDWRAMLTITHSAAQRRFDNEQVFGRADIEAYSLVNLSVSRNAGPGRFTMAITNLLNESYFTPDAYRFAGDSTFTAGTGAQARLTYSVNY